MARSRKTRKPHSASAAAAVAKSPSAKHERREKALERARAKKTERLVLAGLLLISALAFVNSLDGGFVYDDKFQVVNNPRLDDLGNIPKMFTESVWQFMDSTSQLAVGSYYRPIFNIALIIERHLFGLEVFGWHLASLLLHLGVVFLVYLLGKQWGMSGEVAAAAALLFGVHPAHSESVAWVSGLPDPLAAVFVLGSLIVYERAWRAAAARRAALAVSVGLAFLAMLSKEVAIVLPVFLLLREWLDRSERGAHESRLWRTAKRTLPFAIVTIAYMVLRYGVLGFISKPEPKSVGVTMWQVLLTIPSVLLNYARMLVWPYPLAITYPAGYVSSLADPAFWAVAIAILVIGGGAFWRLRKSAAGLKAFVLMLLFLLPVLNLKAFNPQESLIHDRYLYLPSVGFCMLAALAIARLSELSTRRQAVFRTAVASIAALFLLLTVNQNLTWQNDLLMANAALKLNRRSPFLLNYVGAYYFNLNQPALAEKNYADALDVDPKYYDALSNLGDVYQMQSKLADAEEHYSKAIEYGAPYVATHYNLGVTYIGLGKFKDATRALVRALEIQPSNVSARYNLAWSYDQLGSTALAEQAYVETLQYRPSYPEPRINLGVLLTKQGRLNEALAELQTAQTYVPDHPVMLYALGDVLLKQKRYEDAIAQFKQLVQSEPQHKLVYTALGLCYEGLGNRAEAKTQFQKAIDVAPQDQYTNTAREHLAKL